MDHMSVADLKRVLAKPVDQRSLIIAAAREFFTSSQLSQLLDGLTHCQNWATSDAWARLVLAVWPVSALRLRRPPNYGVFVQWNHRKVRTSVWCWTATYARVNEYRFVKTPYLAFKDQQSHRQACLFGCFTKSVEVIADAGGFLATGSFLRDEAQHELNIQPNASDTVRSYILMKPGLLL